MIHRNSVFDHFGCTRLNEALARLATYTALVVIILVVIAIMNGNVLGLAWHKVKVDPG